MMKRMLARTVLCLGLSAVGVFASACSESGAEQNLAGEKQAHERHATGIDS